MTTDLSLRKKRIERTLREVVDDPDRFVDIGVELRTVVADPAGQELLDGKPPLRIVRVRHFGGMLDTRATPPRICGPSQSPLVWYCSLDQEKAVLGDDGGALGRLLYGSEGAGKTLTLVLFHYIRWIEHLGEGREGGQTAPTDKRLDVLRKEMFALYPSSWFRYRIADGLLIFADGSRIRFVATHRQSKAAGSPVQGFSWSWCGRDEAQDQVDAHSDIESRGRAAKGGRYRQLATATAKDDSEWRACRDALLTSGQWVKQTMLGVDTPFVSPAFWDAKRATMSPREYERRVLAQDVGVELAVYYGWQRDRNLVVRPQIATDVTASILSSYRSYVKPGARFTLLVAHDPGNIYNTSVVSKLLMFGDIPTWVVVGEWQSKQTTGREHAKQLKKYLQDTFGVEMNESDSDKAAIFCDPHGKGESQTDYQTVYMAFQREGLDVFSPAPVSGRIKRAARVEMVNRLLGDARGVSRLVIAVDQQKQPAAPILVRSFESLEKRPGDDNPEGSQRKDASDQTHAPAALAYGLWPFEQEAFTDATQATARAAAKRLG